VTAVDHGAGTVLGPAAEIPPGEGRAYAVGGEQVAVFRPRNGPLRAFQAACPHAGGPLADGQLDDDVLICPLHLNVWELDGGCSRSGQADLKTYGVAEVEGVLVLSPEA
jgi:nitrite reductase (NADH) small subunit